MHGNVRRLLDGIVADIPVGHACLVFCGRAAVDTMLGGRRSDIARSGSDAGAGVERQLLLGLDVGPCLAPSRLGEPPAAHDDETDKNDDADDDTGDGSTRKNAVVRAIFGRGRLFFDRRVNVSSLSGEEVGHVVGLGGETHIDIRCVLAGKWEFKRKGDNSIQAVEIKIAKCVALRIMVQV